MKSEWRDAARNGDATRLARLVEQGADVNALDRYGQTALMLASLYGHLDVVRKLVSVGAKLDCTAKYHLSALMLATLNGRTQIAEILIEAGADTTIRGSGAPGFAGKTALDLAEHHGRDEIAALLR